MAIEVKFKVKGDDEVYDDPMEAVTRAALLSQKLGGEPLVLMRGSRSVRRFDFRNIDTNDYQWTSLGVINMPEPITETGAQVTDEKDYSPAAVLNRSLNDDKKGI